MDKIIPDKLDNGEFAISFLGVDEIALEEQEGSVAQALDKTISLLSGYLVSGANYNIEIYNEEKLEKQYEGARLTSISNNYIGDDDMVVDQSMIGGTSIELNFNLKDGTSKLFEITIGKSTILLQGDIFQIITGEVALGEKLLQIVIKRSMESENTRKFNTIDWILTKLGIRK